MKNLVLLLLICTPAYADWNVSVGPEVSHITYDEKNLVFGGKAVDMKEEGVMYGVHGILEHQDRLYLAIDGRYSQGEVDYSGTGTIEGIKDYTYEAKGLVGLPYQKVVFYTGYGYRYLNDNSQGMLTSTGLLGYERESTYHYVPIGAKLTLDKLTFRAEIDALITGEQISHLEVYGPFEPQVRNKQNRGVGFKASVDYTYKNVVFGPFIRTWKIQNSKRNDDFLEPKNTSFEVGGQISVKF